MIDVGSKIFLQVPDNKKNTLYATEVVAHEDDLYTADFGIEVKGHRDVEINIEVGQDVFIYCELNGEFMKQSACVDEIIQTDPHLVLHYKVTSKLVSAENRQCYRASTVISDIYTVFGDEEKCPLLDVSASGFAVMSHKQYKIGDVVNVVIDFEDQLFSGSGSVQSIDDNCTGRYRYGLLGMVENNNDDGLLEGLRHITMAIQRQQLKRLAGVV